MVEDVDRTFNEASDLVRVAKRACQYIADRAQPNLAGDAYAIIAVLSQADDKLEQLKVGIAVAVDKGAFNE